MSNLETRPQEQTCPANEVGAPSPAPVTLLPREVPLGGLRAMTVRRTLPHRDIRTIGAWCFIDDYGPSTPADPPMDVQPHPHMGLQTVSWLLQGRIHHRDSTGGQGMVLPGELNIMTAGVGISHSEYSEDSPELRGVQMWVALPEAARNHAPGFTQYTHLPRTRLPAIGVGAAGTDGDTEALVFIGEFAGVTSPAPAHTPLVGVQFTTTAGQEFALPLRADFEYGVLALDEPLDVGGEHVPPGAMRYLGWGTESVRVRTAGASTFLLFGGEPLHEELLMWWNFVGRSHEEIEQARLDWEEGSRFGTVVDDDNPPLPAPELPHVRLQPRPGRRT